MKTANELTTIAINAASVKAEQDKEDMYKFIESLSEKFEEIANSGEFFYYIRHSDLPLMRTKDTIVLLKEQLESYGFEVKDLIDRVKVSWMKV